MANKTPTTEKNGRQKARPSHLRLVTLCPEASAMVRDLPDLATADQAPKPETPPKSALIQFFNSYADAIDAQIAAILES